MVAQFTAIYMKRGKWYIGYVEEVSGVNTQGRTLAEAKKNLKEALIMVLEANRAIAHRLRSPRSIEEPLAIAV